MSRSGCESENGLSRSDFNDTLRERFARKCGSPDKRGCIPWLGSATSKGYGTFRAGDYVRTTAHRIAWVLKNGDLAPRLLVLHRCDNPNCVNAEHLFVGSQLQNTADMVSKKRHAWRNGTPWQKLGAEAAERINAFRALGFSQQHVANLFGVSRPLISMIENRKVQYAAASASST